MDRKELDSFFYEIQKISERYEEEMKSSGEGFNVFQILGLSYNEVRTHTAFLADLLNPHGSHGMGDTFLELFLAELEQKNDPLRLKKFYQKGKMSVDKEKYIGSIDRDCTEGGSVDLLIKNKNNQAIIVENKINAGDQLNQIFRYFNFGKTFDKFEVYYLTLDGKDASNFSTGSILKNGDYKKISYCDDILSWLSKCEKASEGHRYVPATIGQYIQLIKFLTGQTKYKTMQKEIQDIIKRDVKSFILAEKISKEYNKILYEIIPSSSRQKLFDTWYEVFAIEEQDKKLSIFTYGEYEFFISISEEEKWHTQIWPLKDSVFGKNAASDDKINFVRNSLIQLTGFDIYKNGNYSMWFYSNNRFDKLSIEEKLELLTEDGLAKWASNIVSDTVSILSFLVKNILQQPSDILKEIKWNDKNQKLNEILILNHNQQSHNIE